MALSFFSVCGCRPKLVLSGRWVVSKNLLPATWCKYARVYVRTYVRTYVCTEVANKLCQNEIICRKYISLIIQTKTHNWNYLPCSVPSTKTIIVFRRHSTCICLSTFINITHHVHLFCLSVSVTSVLFISHTDHSATNAQKIYTMKFTRLCTHNLKKNQHLLI